MENNSKGLEKWRQFFASMADGLLPYIQLYVKRNQRGSGLGNFVSSRYRYQVPVVIDNGVQFGGGSSSAHVQIVNPTQSAVDQAKSIIVQENDDLHDLIGDKSTKLKRTSNTSQKKRKRVSKSKDTKPPKRRKNSSNKKTRKDTRKLQFEGIFS